MTTRRKTRRTQTVRLRMETMLRWLREFELDAKELAGGGDPDLMEETRELAALRAAVLRKVLKDYTCELPKTLEVTFRVNN